MYMVPINAYYVVLRNIVDISYLSAIKCQIDHTCQNYFLYTIRTAYRHRFALAPLRATAAAAAFTRTRWLHTRAGAAVPYSAFSPLLPLCTAPATGSLATRRA
jgi:hypothetical protein